MAMYRYRVTPLTSFASPMQSDTLHGHLLWAARELEGEPAIQELIQGFEQGKPPFVCSSAMPRGMLPMPVLPPIPRKRFADLVREMGFDSLFEALGQYKTFRKLSWIPLHVWQELRNGLSQEQLFSLWLRDAKKPENKRVFSPPFASQRVIQAHNSINRATGTVLEGGLFFPEVMFYDRGAELDLYVMTDDRTFFERLLGHLAACGFGADRTTGKGHLSWQRDDSFEPQKLNSSGTHEMTLSVLSAENLGEVRGFYKTFTKYGKVWNGFGERNPFKKPFVAFAEGSVFSARPETGYVLHGIHSDSKVVQVLWPVTLAFSLAATEGR